MLCFKYFKSFKLSVQIELWLERIIKSERLFFLLTANDFTILLFYKH